MRISNRPATSTTSATVRATPINPYAIRPLELTYIPRVMKLSAVSSTVPSYTTVFKPQMRSILPYQKVVPTRTTKPRQKPVSAVTGQISAMLAADLARDAAEIRALV